MTVLSQAALAKARLLYEEGCLSLTAIGEETGIGRSSVRYYARKQGWRPRRIKPQAVAMRPVSWVGKECPGLSLCPERAALIGRAWAAAQSHMNEIELRIAAIGDTQGRNGESLSDDAKAIATLVRTLKDLTLLDNSGSYAGKKGKAAHDAQSTDAAAPDIRLRDELARRLAGLREGRPVAGASGGAE